MDDLPWLPEPANSATFQGHPIRHFDAIEVDPIEVVSTTASTQYCEPTDSPEDADMWSVYLHFATQELREKYGVRICVADFKTEQEALDFERALESNHAQYLVRPEKESA